jgi:hypothetical protein
MAAEYDIRRIEVIDDASVAAMRRLGGVGRLRMMNELTRAGRALMAVRIRDQHPTWTGDQVRAELAKRVRDAAD